MELVLPCLYSEIAGPALETIVKHLASAEYISHITIGLDKATKAEFEDAKRFFNRLKLPHSVIWNDGPRVSDLRLLLKTLVWRWGSRVKAEMSGHVLAM